MTRILFFCMGNICRSPTAEGVMRARLQAAGLADRILVDSAGTHGYHVGDAPDGRTQRHALLRGYDLGPLRARQLTAADFEHFDLLLGMDEGNLREALRIAPPEHRNKLGLLMQYAPHAGSAIVPDPYYGGPEGFEEVLELVEQACDGLLAELLPSRPRSVGQR